MFKPSLHAGQILSNNEIVHEFGCGNMGSMRRSHATNSLVLITDHVQCRYDDVWHGNILNFRGMGKLGDQSLDFRQNRTLCQAAENDMGVFVFEILERYRYTYRGRVELHHDPYPSRQKDRQGNDRQVWMFPLTVDDDNTQITTTELKHIKAALINKAQGISLKELRDIAAEPRYIAPGYRIVDGERTYIGDPYSARFILEQARGVCQSCGSNQYSLTRVNNRGLEVHHRESLECGGSDVLDNMTALCPECHRKMHTADRVTDITL